MEDNSRAQEFVSSSEVRFLLLLVNIWLILSPFIRTYILKPQEPPFPWGLGVQNTETIWEAGT